jgi:hypothetical protein
MADICPDCGHSLIDNAHGPDQNDYEYIPETQRVEYSGSCTYCKECQRETRAGEYIDELFRALTAQYGDVREKALSVINKREAGIREEAIAEGLTRGIAWAMGFVGGTAHDEPDLARDMARNAGIRDKKELRAAGVDQFDLDQIGDILPEEAE